MVEIANRLKGFSPPEASPPQSPHPYDAVPWLTYPYIVSKLAEEVGEGRRVLAIGCRTAPWIEEIAKRSAVVIGVDPDPKLIEYANRRWHHLENVLFEVGDMRSSLNIDNTFDVVISMFAFGELGGMKKTFAESCRILANKGKLIVVEDLAHRGAIKFHYPWMQKAGKISSVSPNFLMTLFKSHQFGMVKSRNVEMHDLSMNQWMKALKYKVGEARMVQVAEELRLCLNTPIGQTYSVRQVEGDILFNLRALMVIGSKVQVGGGIHAS